ncbi:30S ribosomal protein S4 [Candidatus Woesebacteria bacterium]|nr:30S ribosomal protein S4 [Candidatus Woesebacteria bacterium]
MRYTGPKDRLSRREGVDLFGKGSRLTRLAVPPGMHGPRGWNKRSEYGRQLREKQKVKRLYGVTERQFRRYFAQAEKLKENTGESLIRLLERRLDNVVYRLGFVPTRSAARQIVGHGHVLVDEKKVNIPSYQVNEGQVVALDTKAQAIPEIKELLSGKGTKPVSWLERKVAVGKIKSLPSREEVVEPISEQDIVEFYSR